MKKLPKAVSTADTLAGMAGACEVTFDLKKLAYASREGEIYLTVPGKDEDKALMTAFVRGGWKGKVTIKFEKE